MCLGPMVSCADAQRQEAGAWEAGSRPAVVSRLPSAVAFPLPPAASSLLLSPPQPLCLAAHADPAAVIFRRQVWEPQEVGWPAGHRSSCPRDARALYIVPGHRAAEHPRGAGAPHTLGLAPVPGPPGGWRRRQTACVRARERAGVSWGGRAGRTSASAGGGGCTPGTAPTQLGAHTAQDVVAPPKAPQELPGPSPAHCAPMLCFTSPGTSRSRTAPASPRSPRDLRREGLALSEALWGPAGHDPACGQQPLNLDSPSHD